MGSDYGDTWTGQVGFAIQVPNDQSGATVFTPDLLSVDDDVAATWTVHLNAMKYGQGTLPVLPFQVNNRVYNADCGVNSTAGWTAVIQMGANQATERVYVDYPARGCSFEVQTQMFRLSVQGLKGGTATQPILSGYMVRCSRNQPSLGATLTVLSQQGGNTLPTLEPVPPRAVGYRLYTDAVVPVMGVRQASNVGNIIATDRPAVTQGFPSTTADYMADNRAPGYFPIHPQVSFLLLDPVAAIGQALVYVQFLLDLG